MTIGKTANDCDYNSFWHRWYCNHDIVGSHILTKNRNEDDRLSSSQVGHRDPFFFFLFLLFGLLLLGLFFKSCCRLCGVICKKQVPLYRGGDPSNRFQSSRRFTNFEAPILPSPPAAIHISSQRRTIPNRPRFISSSLHGHRSLPHLPPLFESQFDPIQDIPMFRAHTYQRPPLPYGTFNYQRRISEEDEGRVEQSENLPVYSNTNRLQTNLVNDTEQLPPSYDEAVHGRTKF